MFDEHFLRAAIIRLLALLPALTLHEFAHAWSATKAGDPTPAAHGRVSLNPIVHLDPIGTLAILFLPIGWAKPVPINPANFRNPRRDSIITSALGPLSNIAQGIFWCIVLRMLGLLAPDSIGTNTEPTLLGGFLAFMALLNFALAIFNLIPLGPLDGHHILQNLLPYPSSQKYREFNQRFGLIAMIGVLIVGNLTGMLGLIIVLPAQLIGYLISGVSILHFISNAGLFT